LAFCSLIVISAVSPTLIVAGHVAVKLKLSFSALETEPPSIEEAELLLPAGVDL